MSTLTDSRIVQWDICGDFHGMNDFGSAEGGGYSRSRTYTGECYRPVKERCRRRGRCAIAILAAEAKAKGGK